MKTIFEKSQLEQHAYSLPCDDEEFFCGLPPESFLRKEALLLPEISELDLIRHFSELASRNRGIDNCFYPLGSCTMKYNPRVNEWAAALPGFTKTHPLAPEDSVQGNLQVMWELVELLCKIGGMDAGTLVPNAGAQGEFVGIKMIAAYHRKRNDLERTEILVPDSAHGTNPATAVMSGFHVKIVPSTSDGDIDFHCLEEMVSKKTAALMLTNPNTLGIFSSKIEKIASLIHHHGGLLYYDGANLNPLLNVVRPGDMGFDVMHINLHKTFSTPHGGGGPGSGPVLCKKILKEFLPLPRIEKKDGFFYVTRKNSESIGQVASFYGNFSVIVRAYLYARLNGNFGLRRVAEMAVLNANYLKAKLSSSFTIPFSGLCMHEFVVQTVEFLPMGVKAADFAKRLLDYGIYTPTIYFPLIIRECMLIEPTETESKETLDQFIFIIHKIIEEIAANPHMVTSAPLTTPVGRLDEVRAAKSLILKHSL